jgi:hypothetical protein
MPKLAPALTETQILSLEPRAKPYKLGDGKCLYLLVQPTGHKYWRMSYRHHGKFTTLSGGTFPEISLSAARQWREEMEALIAAGIHPNDQRREQRKQAQLAKPLTPTLQFSRDDKGGVTIENYATRIKLSASQTAALKAFLLATPDQGEGE